MNKAEKVKRRRELRKKTRDNVRQTSFVVDYIESKHPNIYTEAVECYNWMSSQYPAKKDLRKTAIYKDWKHRITGQQQLYPNTQPIPFPYPSAQTAVMATGETRPSTPDTTELEPSSPYLESSSDGSEELPPSPCQETSTGGIEKSRELCYNNNFQLRIPLMRYNSGSVATETIQTPTEEVCAVNSIQPTETVQSATQEVRAVNSIQPTETLQTVMEEMLAVDSIQPSILEGISSNLLDKIIEELRADPELKDAVAQVEEELLFEELDIDIDMPEDLLEKELENWSNW